MNAIKRFIKFVRNVSVSIMVLCTKRGLLEINKIVPWPDKNFFKQTANLNFIFLRFCISYMKLATPANIRDFENKLQNVCIIVVAYIFTISAHTS